MDVEAYRGMRTVHHAQGDVIACRAMQDVYARHPTCTDTLWNLCFCLALLWGG